MTSLPAPATSGNTVGAVLCGGRGARVGGADKPLLAWRGLPLVAHAAARLRGQVDTLLISANRNADAYRRWAPVVADTRSEFQGPLAGIEACLRWTVTQDRGYDWLMVCPGDAPLLPWQQVVRLYAKLSAEEKPMAAAVFDGKRVQNLHVLLHCRSALPALSRYLDSGARSAHGWLSAINALEVDCAEWRAGYRNINQLENHPIETDDR